MEPSHQSPGLLLAELWWESSLGGQHSKLSFSYGRCCSGLVAVGACDFKFHNVEGRPLWQLALGGTNQATDMLPANQHLLVLRDSVQLPPLGDLT